MDSMEKIGRIKIILSCLLLLLPIAKCSAYDFFRQVNKNHKYSKRVYRNYLKKYGNASMILTEGTYSVIWYNDNNMIHITRISRTRIISREEYYCDIILNIKEYERECYMESLDADLFESSFYDIKTDSLHEIGVCLDINVLKSNGTDCPVLKELRDIVIKYKMW